MAFSDKSSKNTITIETIPESKPKKVIKENVPIDIVTIKPEANLGAKKKAKKTTPTAVMPDLIQTTQSSKASKHIGLFTFVNLFRDPRRIF